MSIEVIKYELIGGEVNDSHKIETIDIPDKIWTNDAKLKAFIRERYLKGMWLKHIDIDGNEDRVYVDVKGVPTFELKREKSK